MRIFKPPAWTRRVGVWVRPAITRMRWRATRSTAMSAPITLPIGAAKAIWAWVVLPRGMLDAEDFDRLAGLFPGVSSRGDAYRVRLVQRDDVATAFEAEYLSQREAAAEDLMLAVV